MKINNDTLRSFRADFATAVSSLEKSYGVKIHLAKITYSDDSFTGKLEVSNPNAEANNFASLAGLYGLKAEDYGKTFYDGNKVYKIVDILPSSRKYPILVQRPDGQRLKYTAEFVRKAIGR